MEKLFKTTEVDELLRYGVGRTRQLIKQGKIQCIILPDGQIRIPESVVNNIVSVRAKAEKVGDNNAE